MLRKQVRAEIKRRGIRQAWIAAELQSFPDGYPWQGTKSQRYQQVGNAIPPGLAESVLREVL